MYTSTHFNNKKGLISANGTHTCIYKITYISLRISIKTISIYNLGEFWFSSANAQSGYQCEECFKVFANRNSYTNHLPSHQGKTTCGYCGKEFSSPSNLNKHIRKNHVTPPQVTP